MGGGGEAIISRARSWSAPSIAIGRRRRIVQARRARGVRSGGICRSKNAPSEKLSASCPVKNLRVVRDTRPHEVAISLSSFAMLPVISGHVPIDELTKYR